MPSILTSHQLMLHTKRRSLIRNVSEASTATQSWSSHTTQPSVYSSQGPTYRRMGSDASSRVTTSLRSKASQSSLLQPMFTVSHHASMDRHPQERDEYSSSRQQGADDWGYFVDFNDEINAPRRM